MGALLAYVGEAKDASQEILKGLAKVKFLGRDGVSLAMLHNGELVRARSAKRFEQAIREKNFNLKGSMGIGGIRFATHGRPTIENTPPFFDCDTNFAAITGGVIENFSQLKQLLSKKGHLFKSRNDGEVVPHLLEDLLHEKHVDAYRMTLNRVEGPFSLLILDKSLPAIVAYSPESDLFLSQEGGGRYVASEPEMLDSPVLIKQKKACILTPGKTRLLDLPSEKISSIDPSSPEALEKVPPPKFENFMSREIHNQPYALRRALASSQEKYVNLIARMISKGEGLFLTGCGTSYHAARLGGYLFRQISDLTPSVVNAAEFRYYTLKDLEPGAVVLAISQSGRTTDLLRTVRDAKMYGASIIGILNHLATPLMFASNLYLPIGVGEENAIPATKSFLGTLICLYKITLKIAERKQVNRELVASTKERLRGLPQLVQKTIECTEPIIAKIASKIKKKNHIFVLGRGIDLPVALEGSLKFKEAAHIHSEGMTAGELRHGSITLLEKKFPAIFLIPQEKDAREDTYALISEANEIGGDSILITEETDIKAERVSSKVIKVPKTSKLLSPFVKTVPLQLLSYKIGTLRGITVDKPKALSKSVILEE